MADWIVRTRAVIMALLAGKTVVAECCGPCSPPRDNGTFNRRWQGIVGIHPWLAWFRRLGLFGDGQLVGLIDPDVRRWGDCVEGVDVYSATAAKRLDLEIALALDASGRTADIRAELGEAGIEVIPLTV